MSDARPAGVVIAGTSSGVGKTTVTVGVVKALRAMGLQVAPFKAGPDYIDPTYLATAAGQPCSNLDSWMMPPAALQAVFRRASAGADVAIVEGVMGLFDGRGTDDEGSTAALAKALGLPVILVVDAAKTSRSAAATVLGFQRFDPALRVAGVILNRVASERHAALCAGPITATTGLPVLGALQRADSLHLPERYLGLTPTVEGRASGTFFEAACERVANEVDLRELLRIAAEARMPVSANGSGDPWPAAPVDRQVRIAVAADEAFSFAYPENRALLEAWGAEVVPFSPLGDDVLPASVGAVYLGGGFPELYASELAANHGLIESLRVAAARGVEVYAECGGLMYVGEALTDEEGRTHAMAALAPLRSTMATGRRLTLGYREAAAAVDGPHVVAGQVVRGHEFHHSAIEGAWDPRRAAYRLAPEGHAEGYASGNVWASYLHLNFASDAGLARRFIERAAAGERRLR